jgi:hypothetical protein
MSCWDRAKRSSLEIARLCMAASLRACSASYCSSSLSSEIFSRMVGEMVLEKRARRLRAKHRLAIGFSVIPEVYRWRREGQDTIVRYTSTSSWGAMHALLRVSCQGRTLGFLANLMSENEMDL